MLEKIYSNHRVSEHAVTLHAPSILTGKGGVGKTTVALEFAKKALNNGQAVIAWCIRANDEVNMIQDWLELGLELGLVEREEVNDLKLDRDLGELIRLAKSVVNHFQFLNNWIIILDNVQQIPGFFPDTSHGMVIMTSRHQSWVSGERIHLEDFSRESLDTLFQEESNRRIQKMDKEEKQAYEWMVDNIVCGNPMNMMLISSHLRIMKYDSVTDFSKDLEKLLEENEEKLPPIVHVIRKTFDAVMNEERSQWPWKLLVSMSLMGSEGIGIGLLKDLLRGLTGNPTLGNHGEMELPFALSSLANFSLIVSDDDDNTWKMHPIIQSTMRDCFDGDTSLGPRYRSHILEVVDVVCTCLESSLEFPHQFAMWKCCRQLYVENLEELDFVMMFVLGVGIAKECFEDFRQPDAVVVFEQVEQFMIDCGLDVKAEAMALVIFGKAKALQKIGKLEEACEAYQRVITIFERIWDSMNRRDVATVYANMAYVYEKLGQSEEALEQYNKALELQQSTSDSTEISITMSHMASALHGMGRKDEALDHFEKVLEMRRLSFGTNEHPDIAATMTNIGDVHMSMGNLEKALLNYRAVYKIRHSMYGTSVHIDLARSLDKIGHVLYAMGRKEDALESYQNAGNTFQIVYGTLEHEDVIRCFSNTGHLHLSMGNPDKAIESFQQLIEIQSSMYGQNSKQVSTTMIDLATALKKSGKLQEAMDTFSKVRNLKEIMHGTETEGVASIRHQIATIMESLGQYEESLEEFQLILEMRKRIFGTNVHQKIAGTLHNIAHVLKQLGRTEESLEISDQVISLDKELYGTKIHPDVALTMYNKALALDSIGRTQEAIEIMQQVLQIRQSLFSSDNHPDIQQTMKAIEKFSQDTQ